MLVFELLLLLSLSLSLPLLLSFCLSVCVCISACIQSSFSLSHTLIQRALSVLMPVSLRLVSRCLELCVFIWSPRFVSASCVFCDKLSSFRVVLHLYVPRNMHVLCVVLSASMSASLVVSLSGLLSLPGSAMRLVRLSSSLFVFTILAVHSSSSPLSVCLSISLYIALSSFCLLNATSL